MPKPAMIRRSDGLGLAGRRQGAVSARPLQLTARGLPGCVYTWATRMQPSPTRTGSSLIRLIAIVCGSRADSRMRTGAEECRAGCFETWARGHAA